MSFDADIARANRLAGAGDPAAARAVLEALPADDADVALALATLLRDIADPLVARAAATRALSLAEAGGDERRIARAVLALGSTLARRPVQAVPLLDRAARMFRILGDGAGAAEAEIYGAVAAANTRETERAVAMLENLDHAAVDPALRVYAQVTLCACLVTLGRVDDAAHAADRCDGVELVEPMVVWRSWAHARVALARRDHDGAIGRFQEALQRCEGKWPHLEASCCAYVGIAHIRAGRGPEGLPWLERSVATQPDPHVSAVTRCNLALELLARDRMAEALGWLNGLPPDLLDRPDIAGMDAAIRLAIAAHGRHDDVDRRLDVAADRFARHPDWLKVVPETLGRAADLLDDGATDAPSIERAARARGLAWLARRQVGPPARADEQRARLVGLAERGAPLPVLERFRLERPIGEGAMGEVWLARRRGDGGPVAVKIVPASLATDRARQALFHELRAVARLDHPNVIAIVDTGEVDPVLEAMSGGRYVAGTPLFAMAYAAGGSLLPYCGTVGWRDAKALLLEILAAVGHGHARGILHRDIKPRNILLASADAPRGVRVADFGICQALVSEDEGMIAGTPAYMAPEQGIVGQWREVGPWTDLYAVGAVAWALLTGRPPFQAKSLDGMVRAHALRPLPPFRATRPVPAAVEEWLALLLRKDPGERFQAAADAAEALRTLPDEAPATTRTARAPRVAPAAVTLVAARGAGAAGRNTAVFAPPADMVPCRSAAPQRAPRAPLRRHPRTERAPSLGEAPAPRLVGLRRPPLTGRQPEEDALWTALLRVASAGRSEAVALTGTPGVGRSRLISTFAESAHESGAEVLREDGGGVAPTVRRWLRLAPDGAPSSVLRARAVRALEIRGLPEDLAERAIVAIDEDHPDRIDAFVALAVAASRVRPLVLTFDEVGAEGAEVARRVVGVPGGRVLAVLGDSTAWAPTLAVPPLPPDAARGLLARLVRLDGPLQDELVRRADGRPKLLVDTVVDWVQRGLLVSVDGQLQARAGVTLDLPADTAALWLARTERLLDGLPPAARRALALAAVIGTEVEDSVWRRAAASTGLVVPDDLVRRLLDAGWWTERDGGYVFATPVLREALLADGGARPPELHLAVARALEGGQPSRRALHLLQGGRASDALKPLLAVVEEGNRARRPVSRWVEALDAALAESGLDEADARVVDAAVALAEAYRWLHDDRSRPFAERAAAVARRFGDPARLAVALSELTFARAGRRPAEARATAEEALALARGVADPDVLSIALIASAVERRRAQDLDAAIALLREELPIRGRGAINLASYLNAAGRHAEAAEVLRDEQVLRSGSADDVASELGNTLSLLGDAEGSRAAFVRAAALRAASGDPRVVIPRINLAIGALREGRTVEATELLVGGMDDARRLGRRDVMAGIAAVELAIVAPSDDDALWDEAFHRLLALLEARLASLNETLSVVQLASGRAGAAGQHARARDAERIVRTWSAG